MIYFIIVYQFIFWLILLFSENIQCRIIGNSSTLLLSDRKVNKNKRRYLKESSQCEFSDVDIFFVTNTANYDLMEVMLNSFDIFMPCYNHMHVFVVIILIHHNYEAIMF